MPGPRLPERGTTARSILVGVAAAAVTLVFTQLVLPGSPGSDGRGTPAAILFTGVVFGLVNALTAAGLVLVYRTTRVINFAQTALGAAGAEFLFQALQLTEVPFWVAFPIALAFGALVGLAFDVVLGRRFFDAPRLVLTVATIAVAGFLGQASRGLVNALPIFPRFRTFAETYGNEDIRSFLPFPGWDFTVGSLGLRFGFAEVAAIEIALLSLVAVAAFFRFTRAGIAVRALAENSERAALLGIGVGTLSSIVWTLAGTLSAASVSLTGMLTSPGAAAGFAPGVLLPALAAATIARFRSLPVAVLASVGIGIVTRSVVWSFRSDLPLVNVALFAVIAVGLLAQRRRAGRSEEGAGVSWQATEEQRPVPKELAGVPSVRLARVAIVVLGLVALVVYPFVVGTGPIVLGGVVALTGILGLSIVVLTGWAGQVSLGQWALASVGGVASAALTEKVGVPFWFAVPIATVLSAGFATLVGVPALRIKGLFLAVTTFAFAIALNAVLFDERYFGWLLPGEVTRPTLLFLDFDDERSMYFLSVLALVVSAAVVLNLRRSRFGRTLIAMRENEANVQSFGIPLVRTKLLAFAVSGGLAGFAGAIYAVQQRGLTPESFSAGRSVELFLLAVVGGVGSIAGVLLGALYFSVSDFFFPTNPIVQYFKPFSVILTLYALPGGLISLVMMVRDGVLRIVAQRRQLVVPSLFADVDPDALARRLVPLAEPDANAGLAVMPPGRRFSLRSELYRGRRTGPAAEPAQTREAAALRAAAARAEEPTPTGGAR